MAKEERVAGVVAVVQGEMRGDLGDGSAATIEEREPEKIGKREDGPTIVEEESGARATTTRGKGSWGDRDYTGREERGDGPTGPERRVERGDGRWASTVREERGDGAEEERGDRVTTAQGEGS